VYPKKKEFSFLFFFFFLLFFLLNLLPPLLLLRLLLRLVLLLLHFLSFFLHFWLHNTQRNGYIIKGPWGGGLVDSLLELGEVRLGGEGEQRQLILSADVVHELVDREGGELGGPPDDVALVPELVHVNHQVRRGHIGQLRVKHHVGEIEPEEGHRGDPGDAFHALAHVLEVADRGGKLPQHPQNLLLVAPDVAPRLLQVIHLLPLQRQFNLHHCAQVVFLQTFLISEKRREGVVKNNEIVGERKEGGDCSRRRF